MALVHTHFYSEVLGLSCSMDVILPQTSHGVGLEGVRRQPPYPVLWLLHGGTDDHTIWQRRTSIERYAAEKGLAVIMPCTFLGFYTDMKQGMNYYTFFTQELPGIAAEFFPGISTRREDTFVAGNSMGGYGAFKLALSQPQRFGAAASLSGALDLVSLLQARADQKRFYHIYGTAQEAAGSCNDLFTLAEQLLASGQPMPKLLQICGTEDFLYEDNIRFRDAFADKLGITYHEEPGVHEWAFWDRQIQRVIDWLPLEAE